MPQRVPNSRARMAWRGSKSRSRVPVAVISTGGDGDVRRRLSFRDGGAVDGVEAGGADQVHGAGRPLLAAEHLQDLGHHCTENEQSEDVGGGWQHVPPGAQV